MLLTQFPDINMVRQLRNDASRTSNVWRNVALKVQCRQASRTGVESPYSIFLNNRGFSYCTVNKTQYRVETDAFLLAQPGEMYDLVIDNPGSTETSNIHINRDHFNSWAYTLTTSHWQLLDDPQHTTNAVPLLFTQLYRADPDFLRLVGALLALDPQDDTEFEMLLNEIVRHLLLSNCEIRSRIAQLPFVKAAVRADIYKRLSLACDYIHSNCCSPLAIDAIATEIGMSKFHFLRVFKGFYGVTPHQYIAKIRMGKAAAMLISSDSPVATISDRVGFEYPNSFTKLFRKMYNSSPLQYRKQNSNFG